jgi:hypothetical protein
MENEAQTMFLHKELKALEPALEQPSGNNLHIAEITPSMNYLPRTIISFIEYGSQS